MKIEEVKIADIKPYERNQKKHPESQVKNIAKSIEKYGFVQPIVIDKNNEIIIGHGRYMAGGDILGMKTVPCVRAENLTEQQIRELRILDNKLNESDWDIDLLKEDLDDLDFDDFDIDWGEDDDEPAEPQGNYDDFVAGSLSDKYIVPPFSVLNVTSAQWMERKRLWKQFIKSTYGRKDDVLGSGLTALTLKQNHGKDDGTSGVSEFDPVLAEILLAWFCPKNGRVIDCFAGGSVRGLVSAFTGRKYSGMDLRQEQINANEENWNAVQNEKDFYGNTLEHPEWICGDSITIADKVSGEYDFMLTCPPYADLEVYSDDPKDLSNMDYPDFVTAYRQIIKATAGRLKENAFAAIVVGEVRDKKGYYYNFVSDTIQAFRDAELQYYNEIILTQPIGTAALRANRTFGSTRKVVKCHQNVLIFLKGSEKNIDLQPYDYEIDENTIQKEE